MIAKVRNGLYLFPAKLPLGGVWTPDDATAINALIADKQARYQITGPASSTVTATMNRFLRLYPLQRCHLRRT